MKIEVSWNYIIKYKLVFIIKPIFLNAKGSGHKNSTSCLVWA
jgi:hypothetical protein